MYSAICKHYRTYYWISLTTSLYLHWIESASWSWWCGSWIHNYLCNQYLSRCEFESCSGDTTLCDKVLSVTCGDFQYPIICSVMFTNGTVHAGLGLWSLTPLSTIFQLYRGSQLYWWRKTEHSEKTGGITLTLTNTSINNIHKYHSQEWNLVFSFILNQLLPRYNWNIVESGVKHHNHNPISQCKMWTIFYNVLKSWYFFPWKLFDQPIWCLNLSVFKVQIKCI
jgi:hypothetical protein